MMFGLWFSLKVHGLQIGKSKIFLVLYVAYFVVREEGMGWGVKTLMEE